MSARPSDTELVQLQFVLEAFWSNTRQLHAILLAVHRVRARQLARNCWFPNVGTNAFQSCFQFGELMSHMLEPILPNVGTTGSDFEEGAIPKHWNQCFPTLEPPSAGNHFFPNFETVCGELLVPKCWNQSWNHGFPVLGTSGHKRRNQ